MEILFQRTSDQSSNSYADSVENQNNAKNGDTDLPKAPKNNKPCFKCNQPGHFAKVCYKSSKTLKLGSWGGGYYSVITVWD